MIIAVHILLRQWLGDKTLSIAVCGVQQGSSFEMPVSISKHHHAQLKTQNRESQPVPRDRIEYRAYICISTF
jgi:hypothetical protein